MRQLNLFILLVLTPKVSHFREGGAFATDFSLKRVFATFAANRRRDEFPHRGAGRSSTTNGICLGIFKELQIRRDLFKPVRILT